MHPVTSTRLGAIQQFVFAREGALTKLDRTSIATWEVVCGIGNVVQNKGALGVRFVVGGRSVVVLSAHLAAHQHKVKERNADYARVMEESRCKLQERLEAMHDAEQEETEPEEGGEAFDVWGADGGDAYSDEEWEEAETDSDYENGHDQPTTAVPMHTKHRGGGPGGRSNVVLDAGGRGAQRQWEERGAHAPPPPADAFDGADCVIFSGDLNYRLDLHREEVEMVHDARCTVDLQDYDQLHRARAAGDAFGDFREGRIDFPPTFKYDRASNTYDSSKKRRVPAWTDRVLFRSKDDVLALWEYGHVGEVLHGDHRAVYAKFELELRRP